MSAQVVEGIFAYASAHLLTLYCGVAGVVAATFPGSLSHRVRGLGLLFGSLTLAIDVSLDFCAKFQFLMVFSCSSQLTWWFCTTICATSHTSKQWPGSARLPPPSSQPPSYSSLPLLPSRTPCPSPFSPRVAAFFPFITPLNSRIFTLQ